MYKKTGILIFLCLFLCANFALTANAASIKFDKNNYYVLHKKNIRAKIKSKKKIKYWSSNNNIASIKNGKITGKKRGSCTIYAKSRGKTCSAKVYVKANPAVNATEIPVLTWHRIVSDKDKKNLFLNNEWAGSVSDFENQIKYLKDNGYVTVTIDRFYKWYQGKATIPENAVVITFDDGYYETYHLVYPIIRKYNFAATNFIIGNWTPKVTPKYTGSQNYNRIGEDKIKETKKAYPKFDYQSHSWNEHYMTGDTPRVLTMTRAEINEDIKKMKKFRFKYYAYPYGANNTIIRSELRKNGIKMAFGFGHNGYGYAKKSNNQYNIKRIKINGQITMQKFAKIVNRY